MASDPRRDPTRRCLPLAEWPAADRHAWAVATATGDMLDDAGLAARWSAGMRQKVVSFYGRWLTFLLHHGCLAMAALPHERVAPDQVRDYVAELRSQVAPVTVRGRILDLLVIIKVMAPGLDLAWLERLQQRLAAQAEPTRCKDARLRHPAVLFDLGVRLMAEAMDAGAARSPRRAANYRNGLMIAFLAARPLRLRTFRDLRIGRHIVRHENGYMIYLGPEDQKTRRPLEAPLPGTLTAAVDRYVAEMRPVLLQGCAPTDKLWVSVAGTALASVTIYGIVRETTEKALGVPMNPHLFRDALATSLAVDAPEDVGASTTLLGHGSTRTAAKHYNQAKGIDAARRYQAAILDLRRSTGSRRT